jgi:hypothetical protein
MHLTFILLVITCCGCLSLTTFSTSVICGSWNRLCNSLLYSIYHTSPSVMGPKTSLGTFLPNALNKPSPQFVTHQVSDTYKNNGLITVLHTWPLLSSLTDQILSVSAIHNIICDNLLSNSISISYLATTKQQYVKLSTLSNICQFIYVSSDRKLSDQQTYTSFLPPLLLRISSLSLWQESFHHYCKSPLNYSVCKGCNLHRFIAYHSGCLYFGIY